MFVKVTYAQTIELDEVFITNDQEEELDDCHPNSDYYDECDCYPENCEDTQTQENCNKTCPDSQTLNTVSCTCVNKPNKNWYQDLDNDGYHSATKSYYKSPGTGWKTTTLGVDCDDTPGTGANVHNLNKCGKCEAEPADGKCEKLDCVYDQLTEEGNTLNDILNNFDDNSEYSVNIDTGELSANINATTSINRTDKEVNITINSTTLENRTSLGLARTILHESIHARLYEFVLSNGGSISQDDFPGIYDFYRRFQDNWQHEQMAQFYRDIIVDGLKEFDNNEHSDEYYDALSWVGLMNISDHNTDDPNDRVSTRAWSELSEEEKKSIIETIKNERENGSKECSNK